MPMPAAAAAIAPSTGAVPESPAPFDFYDVPSSQPSEGSSSGGACGEGGGGGHGGEGGLGGLGAQSRHVLRLIEVASEGAGGGAGGGRAGATFEALLRASPAMHPRALSEVLEGLQVEGYIYKADNGAYMPL
jgi:hypothetical protein